MGIFKQIFGPTNAPIKKVPSFSEWMLNYPPPSKEVKELTRLIEVFSDFQYKNKDLSASSLKMLIEHAERIATDAKTFEREQTGIIIVKESK
jgi:hypothetical protein